MTEEIMICPKCRLEYRKGFVVCAYCQIPLVEKSKDLSNDKHQTPGDVQGTPNNITTNQKTSSFAVISLVLGILNIITVMITLRAEFNNNYPWSNWRMLNLLALFIAIIVIILGIIAINKKGYRQNVAIVGFSLGSWEAGLMLLTLAWASLAMALGSD
jgi:hypothetical protein